MSTMLLVGSVILSAIVYGLRETGLWPNATYTGFGMDAGVIMGVALGGLLLTIAKLKVLLGLRLLLGEEFAIFSCLSGLFIILAQYYTTAKVGNM